MENAEIAYTLTTEMTRQQTGFFVVAPTTELKTKDTVELGQLMRHEASLNPIGLLRTWPFWNLSL